LRWPLLPSTSPAEPAFEGQNYWRGPVWPVIDWLLWQSLHLLGNSARAAAIRRDSLSQLVAAGEFGEYFEPFTGKQLGSTQQSWTAAVAGLAGFRARRVSGGALTDQGRRRTMTSERGGRTSTAARAKEVA
jgi:hypothetical protein